MRILITGSRNYKNKEAILEAIVKSAWILDTNALTEHQEEHTLILHGGAKGADTLAEQAAKQLELPTEIIRPDYERYGGKAAPLKRNSELVKRSEMTVAAYGEGRDRKGGTWDTAKKTLKANKPLLEIFSNGDTKLTLPTPSLF